MAETGVYPEGTICINLLGEFSISVEGWGKPSQRVDQQRRANRQWSIIAYLAVNRGTDTSAERLIELFWPEAGSGDPLRALWLSISRCRGALNDLGVPDAKNLIQATNGGYRWNPERLTVIDAEEFERQAVARTTEDDRLEPTLAAIALYKGDFWTQAAGGSWAITRQIYYKTLFMQLCQEAVEQLFADERWEEVADICRQAVAEDPGAEIFSVYFIRALTALGQPQKGLEHYEYIKDILKNDYMVELSDDLELARSEAANQNLSGRLPADLVSDYLRVPVTGGAFYCDYPVFRRIVDLETRELARTGKPAQVVLIDILPGEKDGSTATDMKRMERTLNGALRAGDPFTRLSTAQYLVLLPGAAPENVELVMDRVENAFRKANSHSRARIRSYIIPLESLTTLPDVVV